MKRFVFLMFVSWLLLVFPTMSQSRYDYSLVAADIVGNASSNYDKAKAIYMWLCENIDYDTSYTIYDADNCWDNRRGVCQAYCELFCELAKCVNLDAEIISGLSKDNDGHISDEGHAWLFVHIDGNRGILVDPTWGAGSVKGNVFSRSRNPEEWFHVNPEWMIFTHFPELQTYQLLASPLSFEQFASLPALRPIMGQYGFDSKMFLNRALADNLELPVFYSQGAGIIWFDECPLKKELRVGETYRFRIRFYKDAGQPEILLKDDKSQYLLKDWQIVNGSYQIYFVPKSEGEASLSISIKGDDCFNMVIKYTVPKPTLEDLQKLSAVAPEYSPELFDLDNYNINLMKKAGINFTDLLDLAKTGAVRSVPKLYPMSIADYFLLDIPLSGELNIGTAYLFNLAFSKKGKIVIFENGTSVARFETDENGRCSLEYSPSGKGKMVIAYSVDGTNCQYFAEYGVE